MADEHGTHVSDVRWWDIPSTLHLHLSVVALCWSSKLSSTKLEHKPMHTVEVKSVTYSTWTDSYYSILIPAFCSLHGLHKISI